METNPGMNASKSTQLIYDVLDGIADGVYFIDSNGTVTFWNKSAERLLQKKKEDTLGRNLWELFPGAVEYLQEQYNLSIRGNTTLDFEYYYKPTAQWFEIRTYPSPEGLGVYFRDITIKKELAVQLATQKKQQEAMINASADNLWSIDRNFNLLAANTNFISNTEHYSGKQIRPGDNVLMLMSPEEGDKWRPLYERAFNGESFKYDQLIAYQSGKDPIYTELSFYPVINEHNEVTGVACTARDVTSSKRYISLIEEKNKRLSEKEENLRQTTEQLQTILNYSPDMITTIAKDGSYVSVNNTSRHLLGLEPEEIVGRHFTEIVYKDDTDKTLAIAEQILKGKNVTGFFNRLVRKDGSLLPVMWSAQWNETKDLMFSVAHDASDIVAAEAENKAIMERLRIQNQKLRDIAFMQSHEVRKPLANILGLADLLEHGPAEAQVAEVCSLIKLSSQELDVVIRKVVESSASLDDPANA